MWICSYHKHHKLQRQQKHNNIFAPVLHGLCLYSVCNRIAARKGGRNRHSGNPVLKPCCLRRCSVYCVQSIQREMQGNGIGDVRCLAVFLDLMYDVIARRGQADLCLFWHNQLLQRQSSRDWVAVFVMEGIGESTRTFSMRGDGKFFQGKNFKANAEY